MYPPPYPTREDKAVTKIIECRNARLDLIAAHKQEWLNVMRTKRAAKENSLFTDYMTDKLDWEQVVKSLMDHFQSNIITTTNKTEDTKPMSTPKHIEHRIFYGDTDIADMDEDQLFNTIANIQKQQDNLKALKVKSKAIDKRLVKYDEDITAIVKHLDEES